jgi:hypothetical protein
MSPELGMTIGGADGHGHLGDAPADGLKVLGPVVFNTEHP